MLVEIDVPDWSTSFTLTGRELAKAEKALTLMHCGLAPAYYSTLRSQAWEHFCEAKRRMAEAELWFAAHP